MGIRVQPAPGEPNHRRYYLDCDHCERTFGPVVRPSKFNDPDPTWRGVVLALLYAVEVPGEGNIIHEICSACAAKQGVSMAKKNGNGTKEEKTTLDLKTEAFERTLPVRLADNEIADRADRAAHLLAKRDDCEASMKAAAAHAKAQIKEIEAELRKLSTEVRDKTTYRPVACTRFFHYPARRLVEKRDDTGTEIFERQLFESELQVELPLPGIATQADELGKAIADNGPKGEGKPPKKPRKPRQPKTQEASATT